jgi:hypothetical protein
MAILLSVYAGINIVSVAVAIGAKWLIIGRIRPGRYPIWGSYYFRWWLAGRCMTLGHIKWLQNSPAICLYLRALGAKVGRDAIIGDIDAGAVDLISIGDHATLGAKLVIANAELVGNELVIGPVEIGQDVAVGSSCVISYDAKLARNGRGRGRVVGRLARLQGRHGRRRRAAAAGRRAAVAPAGVRRDLCRDAADRAAGEPAADLPGLLHLRSDRRRAASSTPPPPCRRTSTRTAS